jgi:hypothetical protein
MQAVRRQFRTTERTVDGLVGSGMKRGAAGADEATVSRSQRKRANGTRNAIHLRRRRAETRAMEEGDTELRAGVKMEPVPFGQQTQAWRRETVDADRGGRERQQKQTWLGSARWEWFEESRARAQGRRGGAEFNGRRRRVPVQFRHASGNDDRLGATSGGAREQMKLARRFGVNLMVHGSR